MECKNRIHPRLKNWDYSRNGAYFVTICSKDKAHIFGRVSVGRVAPGAPCTELTPIGKVVEKHILACNDFYENISVDKYVIMPNHVHILLSINAEHGAPGATRPTVSQMITAIKRLSNKETGQKLWQTSFYDHIIRDENDYLTRWKYIDDNPAKWAEDEYYLTPTQRRP